MKPMISPWTIYFASRADAVGTLFLIVAVAAFAICLIGFDDLTKNGFKLFYFNWDYFCNFNSSYTNYRNRLYNDGCK